MKTSANLPEKASPAPSGMRLTPEILTPGNKLTLRLGHETVSGIVDEVMPDQSCFWIWADGGMGRRMIDARDATLVTDALTD